MCDGVRQGLGRAGAELAGARSIGEFLWVDQSLAFLL